MIGLQPSRRANDAIVFFIFSAGAVLISGCGDPLRDDPVVFDFRPVVGHLRLPAGYVDEYPLYSLNLGEGFLYILDA